MEFTPLLTDYYELTMCQGYFLRQNRQNVVFDMFFRRQPFGGGFTVFAGLEPLIEKLVSLAFSPADLDFLAGQKIFQKEFIDYLAGFRFTGDLYAVEEGLPVFPGEPLLRVHANLIEAQLIESFLLNTINFQSLIATKAARLAQAAKSDKLLEFGLRRAQGVDGALSASRAAFIGGALATSNALAGRLHGIPVSGTMAHSWVMSFNDEYQAFRAYAEIYPDNAVFLVDTYDTLKSGLPNAMRAGRELLEKGKNFGVRLDSGDLQYLSEKVRQELDRAGFHKAYICVSNDLNEEIIQQLVLNKAPIDYWGVGTQLATGGRDSSLSGVYKLACRQENGRWNPVVKVSNHPEKSSNPGVKQVFRYYDQNDSPLADLVALESENIADRQPRRFNHPVYRDIFFVLEDYHRVEPLLKKKISRGLRLSPPKKTSAVKSRAAAGINNLHRTYRRLINPHVYKVSLSDRLRRLRLKLIDERSYR